MKRTPIAHVIFPRANATRPVPEFAWGAVQALAATPDLDVNVYVPVPIGAMRGVHSAVRRARGAAPWPEGLESALLALDPKPILVPYVPFPRRSTEVAAAAVAAHLVRGRRATRPRVVHGSFLDEGGYAAAMVGRVLDTPSVVVAHGSDVRAARGELEGEGRRRRALEAVQRAGRVLACSAFLAKELALVGARAEVLHFTSRAAMFPLAAPERRAPEVLFVGRIGRAKGVDLLLEAFAKLRNKAARLRLVGPLDHYDLMPELRRLGLEDRVDWAGEVRQAELPRLYAASSCVALPSRAEGLPCVLVEALLTGRPVVGSDVGGIAELVDERVGRLVPPGDAFQLAAALDQVLEAWEAKRFDPQALRARALPLTWEAAGPKLAEITRGLLRMAA